MIWYNWYYLNKLAGGLYRLPLGKPQKRVLLLMAGPLRGGGELGLNGPAIKIWLRFFCGFPHMDEYCLFFLVCSEIYYIIGRR